MLLNRQVRSGRSSRAAEGGGEPEESDPRQRRGCVARHRPDLWRQCAKVFRPRPFRGLGNVAIHVIRGNRVEHHDPRYLAWVKRVINDRPERGLSWPDQHVGRFLTRCSQQPVQILGFRIK